MSQYWSRIVHNLSPYVPGEQPQDKQYIKLNTNENPYPPSPKVKEAIEKQADNRLRLYPDPNSADLIHEIAKEFHVKEEQVFVGNGSDEVLAFSFQAFFNPGHTILYPDITYSFYPVYSSLYQIHYQLVPLDDELSIPIQEFCKGENGGVIFPNPNAPTGKYLNQSSIRKIVENNSNCVVIVDEAYIDFGGESAASLVNEYPNLLVIQTFSKSRSLAGLRVGFAIGHEDLIEGLNRLKNSFNSYTIDRVASSAAIAALRDKEYFEDTTSRVVKTRDDVTTQLDKLGFDVVPSKANFIFFSHPKHHAESLYRQLKEKGILVRHFNKPRIDNYLRVSIGTEEEMNKFLKELKGLIE